MENANLPAHLEAEQAVLGAILLDNAAYDVADEKLIGDEFHLPAHDRIFQAMRDLREDGEPIDLVTLTARLKDKGQLETAGGVTYIAQLARAVPTAANVGYYAGYVAEEAAKRRNIQEAQKILNAAKQAGNPAELAAAMAETAATLADRTAKGNDFRTMADVMIETYETVEQRSLNRSKNGVPGIPSGYTDLDRMTGGFQNSDLIIIAARPSVGKTAFAQNIAENAGIREKKTVAVFSLEMSASQLGQRAVSAEGNIDASHIRSGWLEGDDWERMTYAISALSDSSIFIDDTPGISVSDIRSKCRRLKKQRGLDLILIDYLQLITVRGRRENRQQEVSEISRTLKQIARELNVPVIALSQLSRGVEQRQDKRPIMSDLRESGSLEQDADVVAFLYRDDYYNKETDREGIIEIILAKQRNGPVGTVELAFLKHYNKFLPLDQSHHSSAEPQREQSNRIPDMYRAGAR